MSSASVGGCLAAEPTEVSFLLRQDSVCARLWLSECLTAKPDHEDRVP